MQVRQNSIHRITDHLARIKSQVALSNSIQLFDINIHSEEFFKGLLNKVYGYRLENLNNTYALTESIDLGDTVNGIAFQITSEKSRKKITDTVSTFQKNGTSKDYPILKIFVLGDKPKRSGEIVHDEFKFDLRNDIIDFSDLLRAIAKLETPKINEIEQWIESELQNNKFGSHLPPTSLDFDKCFNKFLNTDIDVNTLLFKAQPSLADCREIFSNEYYLLIHQFYSTFYFSMLANGKNSNDKLRDKDVYVFRASSLSDIKNGKHNLPGGMSEIVDALRPGKFQYYTISFRKREDEHGITFNIWVFLNGRWVFFPKPWQVVLGIRELKNHRGMKIMVRTMKFFGFRINGVADQAGVFATTILLSELTKK
jgi:hypothetical protein